MSVKNVFVSHATADDDLVEPLRERLAPYGIAGWHDSRELTGGDALLPDILKAIDETDTFILVLSRETINSTWVTKEVKHALEVKATGKDGYKIIPLLRDGIRPSALHHWFGEEPLAVLIEDGPGSLDKAMPDILAALGERLPMQRQAVVTKPVAPVAELILELVDPKVVIAEGKTRATATARLIYNPADPTAREVESNRYLFTAPLGPIETGELAWYLEHYWRWPTSVYKERAARIEKNLPEWGKLLYEELHKPTAQEAFTAWETTAKGTERRFTVRMDRELMEGSDAEAQKTADEAATLLLSLPWELLHDGKGYLFQGARGVRVRRQLPNRNRQDTYTTKPPIRVLLVSPRPEDKQAGYLDHRVSARPLVAALSPLGDLAHLKLLTPPTFPAMVAELQHAAEAGTPYHVVHFDGHGIYNPKHGLGALCFENPADVNKAQQRGVEIVDGEKIAEAIRDCRVPLFFLEACQSAMSDKDPTASVAGQLLEGGVASVVAMSHSVLVETARRFVETFYQSALHGDRVGQAMLAGQRRLKDDTRRIKTFDGLLHLEDWFVPVLYQEENDPQLVASVPEAQVQAERAKEQKLRLGAMPPEPEQTFVGRSRELLAAERLLEQKPYVVVQGEGGEGKTTLACELARWLVQTGRFERAAFVPFDKITTADATLSMLGDQLVPNYQSKAGQGDNRGWLEVERVLYEQTTLIVLDNMETVLQPPAGSPGEQTFEPDILADILTLCGELRGVGKTRLLFTSREPLPEPFAQNTIGLGRLSKTDAIELVAKTLGEGNLMPGTIDEKTSEAEIEALVDTVGCHARALVLLGREVARTGVRNATTQITQLMADLHKAHPNDRERSLLASVKLSLARLPADTRKRIRPLGVFQGGASLTAIARALQIEDEQLYAIGQQLVGVGLVEPQEYGYLRFDPALAPTLMSEMNTEEQETARSRWAETMQVLAGFLYEQQYSNPQLALGLAAWEMPNLLVALEHQTGTTEVVYIIQFATQIETLMQKLGRVRAVAQAEGVRREATKQLGEWSHAAYLTESAAINRLWNTGRFAEAVTVTEHLLQHCEAGGENAFPQAAYDMAMAYAHLGRARMMGGASGAALSPLVEAERRFTLLGEAGDQDAVRMASTARSDRAGCLIDLGRLDEAAGLYEQAIKEDKLRGNPRDVAAIQFQLGTVRMFQQRYPEALQACQEAQKTFERLNEPQSVATAWHQMGIVYMKAGDYPSAERAYQEALQLWRQIGHRAHQADSLHELGNLYLAMKRHEEAARLFGEAATIYVELNNDAAEGSARNNAANSLLQLHRYDEARRELERAIECKKPFGHAASLWNAFALLHNLERAVRNEVAAQAAQEQAMQAYRAYRQEGGESMDWGGQVVAAVRQALVTGQSEAQAAQLVQLKKRPDMPDERKLLLVALQQILSGSRNPALADDPNLYYMDAVELRLLLEELAMSG
jgi:tetratricopeptide (TPR) repeat protein